MRRNDALEDVRRMQDSPLDRVGLDDDADQDLGATRPERFAFEENADEDLWATRDYFWALHAGLLDGHSAPAWSSFRAGYTCPSARADVVGSGSRRSARCGLDHSCRTERGGPPDHEPMDLGGGATRTSV